MLDLVVFDLDGTLIDSLPDLAEAVNELLDGYGAPALSAAQIRGMIGDGAAILVKRALAASSVTDDGQAVARFMALYEPRATRLTRPFEGARDILDELGRSGIACAVCTNKPHRAAEAILARFELLDKLRAVTGGDTFAVRKPDPAHVRLTVEMTGYDPMRAVMIGDHHNDMRAGSGAGLRTIFAQWGYGPATVGDTADYRANALSAIPSLISNIREL